MTGLFLVMAAGLAALYMQDPDVILKIRNSHEVHLFSEKVGNHSAAARMKFAAFSAIAQVHLQSTKAKITGILREYKAQEGLSNLRLKLLEASKIVLQNAAASATNLLQIIQDYNAQEKLSKLTSELYEASKAGLENAKDAISPMLQTLTAHAQEATSQKFGELVARTSQLKAWMQSEQPAEAMLVFQEWCRWEATNVQLASLAVCFVLVLIAFAKTARVLCCRCRRTLAAPDTQGVDINDMSMGLHILKDASLSTERLRDHPPTPLHRRRRSDSPAPVAHEDAWGTDQDLLSRLNSASAEDLQSMAGLGSKSIDRIIQYRSSNGDLETVRDLVTRVGIHPATFANFTKAQCI